MTASNVQITAGSGTRLATNSYTEGAVTVHDEKFVSGLPFHATYTAAFFSTSAATAASHIFALNAGSTLNVYVQEIRVFQLAAATTAAFMEIAVKRLTTLGTGGTVITPAKHDTTDAAAGATCLTLNTAKGTETDNLDASAGYLTQTPGAANGPFNAVYFWQASQNGLWKPWRIPAGTANGIAVKNNTAHAAATLIGHVIFSEALI